MGNEVACLLARLRGLGAQCRGSHRRRRDWLACLTAGSSRDRHFLTELLLSEVPTLTSSAAFERLVPVARSACRSNSGAMQRNAATHTWPLIMAVIAAGLQRMAPPAHGRCQPKLVTGRGSAVLRSGVLGAPSPATVATSTACKLHTSCSACVHALQLDDLYEAIHDDLKPWANTGIDRATMARSIETYTTRGLNKGIALAFMNGTAYVVEANIDKSMGHHANIAFTYMQAGVACTQCCLCPSGFAIRLQAGAPAVLCALSAAHGCNIAIAPCSPCATDPPCRPSASHLTAMLCPAFAGHP